MAFWHKEKARPSRWFRYRPFVERMEDRSVPSFITAPNYVAGMGPQSIAVGDFNSDGLPDLAVVNANDGTVSILLGKGGGTFQAGQPYVVGSGAGSGPQSVAVAD